MYPMPDSASAKHMSAVTVAVPATTANLGSGFDAVGMALELENCFTVDLSASDFSVEVAGEGAESISRGRDNLFFTAMEQVYRVKGMALPPCSLSIKNCVPTGRGLGSSATAIVGGLTAANHLLGDFLEPSALIDLAAGMEGHPDNVAPAVLGGVVIATGGSQGHFHVLQLPHPAELEAIVAVPDFELPTSRARSVLPHSVPFSDAVFNGSRAALLGAVLATRQWELLHAAMEDRLHQNYRQKLVPGLSEVFAAARAAGALGVAISGAGPAIVALATGGSARIGEAMKAAFASAGVDSRILLTLPATAGAHIIGEGVFHEDHRSEVWR